MHDDDICAGTPCTIQIGAAKKDPPPTLLSEVPATVVDVERDKAGAVNEILVRKESNDADVTTKNGDEATAWYLPDEALFKAFYQSMPCGLCAPLARDLMWEPHRQPSEWPPCKQCKGTKVVKESVRDSFRAQIELSKVQGKPPKPFKRAPLWFTFILIVGERRSLVVSHEDLAAKVKVVQPDPSQPGITTIRRERPHLPFNKLTPRGW